MPEETGGEDGNGADGMDEQSGRSGDGSDVESEFDDGSPEQGFELRAKKTGRPGACVSTDELFRLLASPGNRFVLTYLLRTGSAVEYADVVEYVVDRAEAPEEMTEAKFRGHVAASLINERLPELEEAGLVDVDSTRQRVSSTPAAEVAAPHLALALSTLTNPRQRD